MPKSGIETAGPATAHRRVSRSKKAYFPLKVGLAAVVENSGVDNNFFVC